MRLITFIICILWVTAVQAFWHGNTFIIPPPSPYGSFTTFYVSSTGNDSNDGMTPGTAWKTVNKVNNTLFAAHSAVAFHGNDVFIGGLVISSSVTPGDFAITSYGGGQAIIASGGNNECVLVSGTVLSSFTIDGITCQGSGNTTGNTDGIKFAPTVSLSGLTITNSTIFDYGRDGILIGGSAGGGTVTNLAITNNVVHDTTGHITTSLGDGTACVLLSASNVTITGNTVYNCTGVTPSSHASGLGIFWGAGGTGVISQNVVHDSGQNNNICGGPAGIIIANVGTATISENEVYNISNGVSPGCDGEGIDLDCSARNSIVEYNWVRNNVTADIVNFGGTDCGTGNGPNRNNVVRFNIAQSSGSETPLELDGSIGSQFYNNTFYTPGNLCIAGSNVAQVLSATIVANNICYMTASGQDFISIASTTVALNTTKFQGNDYFGSNSWVWGTNTYASLAAFQTGCGSNCNPAGTIAYPNLTSPGNGIACGGYVPPCPTAYLLTSGSPAGKGNGLNLTSLFGIDPGTQDFYGNTVTTATLPIGAAANH